MLQCTGLSGLKYINGPAWYVSAMFICTPIVYIVVRIKKIGGVLAAVLSAIIYLLAFYYLKDPDMPMEGFIFGYIPAPLFRASAGMLLGVASYSIFDTLKLVIERMPSIVATFFEGIFICCIFRMCYFRQSSFINWLILIPIVGIIILMMAENKGIFSKVLGSKKLDYFAEISYAFYIMQSFCSNFLSCFLPDIKQPYSTLFYLALNFGMAVIVHEVFERNISHFLKKLYYSNVKV